MRQVPKNNFDAPNPNYGIIGNGRVSNHIQHYFRLKNIAFKTWHRQSNDPIDHTLSGCQIYLILICDAAIESFLKQNPFFRDKICIHFSGSLHTPLALSCHPLMTFSDHLYECDLYETIPFIHEPNLTFEHCFPQLNNPHIPLPPHLKPFYHSLCVLSGNFSTFLWQTVMQSFADDLSLPPEVLQPYLQQTFFNIANHPQNAVTGPIGRKDQTTVSAHLATLQNHPILPIYKGFLEAMDPQLFHQICPPQKRQRSRTP